MISLGVERGRKCEHLGRTKLNTETASFTYYAVNAETASILIGTIESSSFAINSETASLAYLAKSTIYLLQEVRCCI